MNKRKILVVDDHPIVRQGLAQLINAQSDLAVCAVAATPDEALECVCEAAPHLAIVDIELQGESGLHLMRRLRDRLPALRVMALSVHNEDEYVKRALRIGADGYLCKDTDPAVVLAAIRRVLDGDLYLAPGIASRLLSRCVRGLRSRDRAPEEWLTDRQIGVLDLMSRGLSRVQIARAMNVSVSSVHSHARGIKKRLGLRTSYDLQRHALEWQLRRSRGWPT
jgi:DNA-binding NarL/FixJ family response regulator